MAYKAKSNLSKNGELYQAGDLLELTPEEAQELLERDLIEETDEQSAPGGFPVHEPEVTPAAPQVEVSTPVDPLVQQPPVVNQPVVGAQPTQEQIDQALASVDLPPTQQPQDNV